MPIPVLCPGCQARFAVSDKFAGKQGPCPKCKATIKIPSLAEVKQQDVVKVHEPEQFASGGKDQHGRLITKPIARTDSKIDPTIATAIGAGFVVVLVLAFVIGKIGNFWLLAFGVSAISPALASGGYYFLRDDEREPYRGQDLWLRSILCGLAYAVLWGGFTLVSPHMSGETWEWLFVAPAFVAVGAAAAWAALDLDFGSAALHYAFYLLVTIILRAAAGLPALWNLGPSS